MKASLPLFPLLTLALAVGVLVPGTFAQTGPQSTLLVIDVSDPAAVKVTATGAASLASDPIQGHNFLNGFDLLDFFTEAPNSDLPLNSSTLTTAMNGMPFFTDAVPDDLSGSSVDLNLHNNNGAESPETFVAGLPAFTGTCSLNLGSLAGLLPAIGTTGNVYIGYNGGGGGEPSTDSFEDQELIGQYIVVPEAGPRVWLLVGGAILLIVRRSRCRPA